jgi:glycosyltransferase involved in cell wall biosynthesis
MDDLPPADVALTLPTLEGGGAERVFKDLANSFVDGGLRVDMVLAWARGPFLKHLDPRVRVVDLASKSKLTVVLDMASYMRRYRPKAILSGLEVMNVPVLVARKISGVNVPVVVSIHVVLSSSIQNKMRDRLVTSKLMSLLYPGAAGVITVSQAVKEDLRNWARVSEDKVRVISNPVDLLGIRKAVHEPLPDGVALGPKTVITIGRMTPPKNQDLLIRAFAAVLHTEPEAQLVILGDGPLRVQIEALVASLNLQNHVLMPGFMPNPFSWLAKSRVFVLSSDFEGFGNVLIEALAVGCPVVSTNCPGGPSTILQDGRFGRLTPLGDVQVLTAAIQDALRETPDEQALKRRAADFDLRKIAREYRYALHDFAGVPVHSAVQLMDIGESA